MNIITVKGSYRKNGILKFFRFSMDNTMSNNDFTITASVEKMKSGEVISLEVAVNREIEMVSFHLEAEACTSGSKMLVNGFQTWTESVFTDGSLRLRNLRMLFAGFMRPYGDYFFYRYTGRIGDLHSHTYTCFTGSDGTSLLVGSIDESAGYTIFQSLIRKDKMIVHKDCEGLVIKDRRVILKLYAAEGRESNLFEEYFEFFGSRRSAPKCAGWTSWYNYYTRISEKIIMNNLEAVKKENIPLDVFQVDDGYQTAVGDWLSINEKFPSGMKHIANEIKKCGFKPGIWLAPFVCSKNSALFREHPDWLLRGKTGKPVIAGWNPNWSGFYYALDICNDSVKRYLEMVFSTIIDDWGFSMLKLDFLYAAGLQPQRGMSRAGVMIEAMDFLQYILSDKLTLGCGVPMAPAYNRVDYCRVGADVAPYWEDRKLKYLRSRERVSTLVSLRNTITRNRLNGRVFLNDPDVFLLRNSNNRLNRNQKYTLFFLNNLLGGLSFTSDNIGEYDEAAMKTYKSVFPLISPEIIQIRALGNDVYEVEFRIGRWHYLAYSNLGGGSQSIFLHLGNYYNEKDFIVEGPTMKLLEPYETKCFLKINMKSDVVVLGTTGYIFPAGHIESVAMDGGEIRLKIREGFINEGEIYILPHGYANEITVNRSAIKVENYKNFRLARYFVQGSPDRRDS